MADRRTDRDRDRDRDRRRRRSTSRSRERRDGRGDRDRDRDRERDRHPERRRSKSPPTPAKREHMASERMAQVVIDKPKEPLRVDREKTCPFLLRVFPCQGRHHRSEEFNKTSYPPDELQIYTWLDATLHELMSLIKEVKPESRRRGVAFSFATVFPDQRRGGFRIKDIGMTRASRKGPDDDTPIGSVGFQIGDLIDVAIDARPRMPMGRRF